MTILEQCTNEGSQYKQYDGFGACAGDAQEDNNDGNYCGDLYCAPSSEPGQCYQFPDSKQGTSSYVKVGDGVPCNGGRQCYKGKCTDPSLLNPHVRWVEVTTNENRARDGFETCSTCGSVQTRSIKCVYSSASGSSTDVIPEVCWDGSRLTTTRLCVNETLGCKYCDYCDNAFNNIGADLISQYGILDHTDAVRGMLVRIYGPEHFDSADQAYWIGLAIIGLFPLLIAIVVLVWACCFGCFDKGCGDKHLDHEIRRCCSRVVFFVLLVVASVWCLALAAPAIYFSGDIRIGIEDEETGVIPVLFEAFVRATDLSDTLNLPLNFLSSTKQDTDVLQPALANSEAMKITMAAQNLAIAAVVSNLTALSTGLVNWTHSEAARTGGSAKELKCSDPATCAAKLTEVAAASTAASAANNDEMTVMSGKIPSMIGFLQDFRRDILSPGTAYGSIAQIRGVVNETTNYMIEKRDMMFDQKENILLFNTWRSHVTLALCCLPIIVFLFTVLGGVLHSEKIYLWNYHLIWATAVIFWFMLAFHLPAAALLSDICKWTNAMEGDMHTHLPELEPQAVTMLEACLTNKTIVAALNMSEDLTLMIASFDFLDSTIPQPSTNALKFDGIEALIVAVNALDFTWYDIAANEVDNAIAALNTAEGGTYTRADVATCVCTASQAEKGTVLTLLDAETAATTQIDAMKAIVTAIDTNLDALRTGVDGVWNKMKTTAGNLEEMKEATENVIANSDCSILGNYYRRVKEKGCGMVTTSLLWAMMSIMLISIMLTPTIFVSIRAYAVAKAHAKHLEHEKDRALRAMAGDDVDFDSEESSSYFSSESEDDDGNKFRHHHGQHHEAGGKGKGWTKN